MVLLIAALNADRILVETMPGNEHDFIENWKLRLINEIKVYQCTIHRERNGYRVKLRLGQP